MAARPDLNRLQIQPLKDALHELLLQRGILDDDDHCWVWPGARQAGGGVIKVLGKNFRVARVAWWVYRGRLDLWDMSVQVMRRGEVCSNPCCFNPDHYRRVQGQAQILRLAARARRLVKMAA
jgi:hypothetical protein